jgi:hypothetical protein
MRHVVDNNQEKQHTQQIPPAAGEDYISPRGTFLFLPGKTVFPLPVPDRKKEGSK